MSQKISQEMNELLATRWHGLDAIRAFALLLGVLLHASMSYLPGAQYFWVAADSDNSVIASVLFFIIHNFRMLLFFLLAGFFARLLFQRLGVRAFARDRWQRIGKPLLIGWPLLFTAIVAALAWGAAIKSGGKLPTETPPGPSFAPDDFPLTHLWFLYALSWFYFVFITLRTVFNKIDSKQLLRKRLDIVVSWLMSWPAPVLLALPMALSLLTQAKWYLWFGIPTPDQSLYLNVPAIIGFGSAFVLGWCLHRQSTLLLRLRERCLPYLFIAITCTALNLAWLGATPSFNVADKSWQTIAYAISYSIAAWSWSLALLGFALRFWSQYSMARRYLADASYWMYLVHLPLVMALQVAAGQLHWPWFVELPLLLLLAFALMLLSYHFVVRNSFIGATLNGRRKKMTELSPPARTSAANTSGMA